MRKPLKLVRIHLKTGPPVTGYLDARMRAYHYVVLEPAVQLVEGEPPQALADAKEVVIPQSEVMFYEVLR